MKENLLVSIQTKVWSLNNKKTKLYVDCSITRLALRFINNSQIGPGNKSIVFTSDFFPASVVKKNK